MVRGQCDVEKRWKRLEHVYMLRWQNKERGRIMEGEEREWNFEHIRRQSFWKKYVFYSEIRGKNKCDVNIDSSSRSLVCEKKVSHDGRDYKWLPILTIKVGNLFWGEKAREGF